MSKKVMVSWIDWDKLTILVCPYLRHLTIFGRKTFKLRDVIKKDFKYERSGVWVAQEEDPCPLKKCEKSGCHNYGTHYKSYNPFVILKKKVSK